jgi:hypothetical protein
MHCEAGNLYRVGFDFEQPSLAMELTTDML